MEIKIRCPFCPERVGSPDRKKRLWLNPTKNLAHCFRCGYATRDAEGLARQLGLNLAVAWNTLDLDDESCRRASIQLPTDFRTDFHATPIGLEAWDYLYNKRRLDSITIAAYNLGYCITGPYSGRVVLPVYQQETLVNFQARSINERVIPKYMGPARAIPNMLFNIDRASHHSVLLLVEGIFDALTIPEYGVGLLGKGWNAAKRNAILRTKPYTIFICLDADARQDEQAIHEDFAGIVPHVASIQVDAKDINSSGKSSILRIRDICRKAELAALHAAGDGGSIADSPIYESRSHSMVDRPW